jgi:hypothetical protein
VFLRVTFRGSPFLRSSHILTKDADPTDSARPLHYSKSDRRVARAPALSTCSSLTHAHRSIGYRNRNPKPLADSAARLMYVRVYDSRDSFRLPAPRLMYVRVYDIRDTSRLPAPSPSLCYSLTHAHWSIGYRNRNPQPLADSAARLMHLRVYDSRDNSHQPAPSPSLYYSLTHAHSTLPTPTLLTITCTEVLWFLERLTRPTVSCCVKTRTRLTLCLPAQPSVGEAF